jgi:hypothetical protein
VRDVATPAARDEHFAKRLAGFFKDDDALVWVEFCTANGGEESRRAAADDDDIPVGL